MPALSTTARTAPPAMTPVPGEAGFRKTRAGAEVAERLVRNGDAVERHPEDVLPRLVVALADRLGDLVRLAEADADVPGLVADDDERAEAEAPAALDDLGDAVDVDDALLELLFVDLESVGPGVLESHLRVSRSELEAGLACGVGEGANAPVVEVAVAVEDDLVDALLEEQPSRCA